MNEIGSTLASDCLKSFGEDSCQMCNCKSPGCQGEAARSALGKWSGLALPAVCRGVSISPGFRSV